MRKFQSTSQVGRSVLAHDRQLMTYNNDVGK
jgi:hypothetical protein